MARTSPDSRFTFLDRQTGEAPRFHQGNPMSKVLVIELPDETTDPRDALILLAHGSSVEGSHVHVAIREDAAQVLAVFTPDPQETP